MHVLLSSELHYLRGPDGHVYTDSLHPYRFWTRYHRVFEQVAVVARVASRPLPSTAVRADGPGVEFVALPDFLGPGQLPRVARGLLAPLAAVARRPGAAILRLPGFVGTLAWSALVARRRRFGAQVVGDPALALAGTASQRRFRRLVIALTARQVRTATALTYVTTSALQAAYPPGRQPVVEVVSDVDLPDALFAAPAIEIVERPRLRAVFVGSLDQPYKGLDLLLRALALTTRAIELTVIGDGHLRGELEALAGQLGVADRVAFRGRLPSSAAVQAALPGHDILVLPSRTEGMPRALLEAMALGLPAIGASVGGVPEVLSAEDRFPPEDPPALAALLDHLDRPRREAMATRQRATAHRFRESERDRRLERFYRAVAEANR